MAAPEVARAPKPEDVAAADAEPMPEKGNLVGFLHMAAQAEIDLAGGSDEAKQAALDKLQSIKTKGEARDYLNEVQAKINAAQADKETK